MIRFKCHNCGQGFKVSDQHAGKQTKCPKCDSTIVVPSPAAQTKPPEQPEIIKFRCPSCNQKIGLAKQYAGKTVRCAKCKNPLQVPGAPRPAVPPKLPKPKHETEILRAGQEEVVSTEGLWGDLGDMEPLRLAEESAPSVEMPQQTPTAQGLGADDLAAYDSALRGGGPYQDTIGKAPKQPRVGLFIGIGCGAAVLVVFVLYIFFVIGVAKSAVGDNISVPEAEELTERFIYLLEDGKISEAKMFLDEELQQSTRDKELEGLAERMIAGQIEQLRCWQTRQIDDSEGGQFLLWYSVSCTDDDSSVIVSVSGSDDEMQIAGIAAMDSLGKSTSVGSSSYEDLIGDAVATVVTDTFESASWTLPCVALVMLAIVGIIQLVAVWAIFEKAGQPGWAILVPFYNMWVWAVVGDRPGWVGLAACFAGWIPVPYVGLLIELGLWIFITIGVAKAFDHGVGFGLGLCFLPVVFYPILAFDD